MITATAPPFDVPVTLPHGWTLRYKWKSTSTPRAVYFQTIPPGACVEADEPPDGAPRLPRQLRAPWAYAGAPGTDALQLYDGVSGAIVDVCTGERVA